MRELRACLGYGDAVTDCATGPAWPDRSKSLAEQLALSLLLVKPTATDDDLDRVHGALESLLLGAVQFVPMECDNVIR